MMTSLPNRAMLVLFALCIASASTVVYAGVQHVGTNNDAISTLEETQSMDVPAVQTEVSISPDASHVDASIQRATALVTDAREVVPNGDTPAARKVHQLFSDAEAELATAHDQTNAWAALISARKASVKARTVIAYARADSGELTAADVVVAADSERERLDVIRDRIPESCTSDECVIVRAEIETSLASADSHLDQVRHTDELQNRPTELRVAYAAGALEAARGNIEDAKRLLERANGRLSANDINGPSLNERYETLHDTATDELAIASYGDSFATVTVEQADRFVERAEKRHANGLTAAAVLDLRRALVRLAAAEQLTDVPNPWTANTTVTPDQVQQAKAAAVDAVSVRTNAADPMTSVLLQRATADVRTGDQLLDRPLQTGVIEDSESLALAYAQYRQAALIAEHAGSIPDGS